MRRGKGECGAWNPDADRRFGPCCVINSGIAGGTKPGLAIGDIVIGEDLAQHDFDVTAFGYALGYMCTGENSSEPTRFTAESVLVEELEQAARTAARSGACTVAESSAATSSFPEPRRRNSSGRRSMRCARRWKVRPSPRPANTPECFRHSPGNLGSGRRNGTGILRSVRAHQRRPVCGSDFGILENPPEAPGRIM